MPDASICILGKQSRQWDRYKNLEFVAISWQFSEKLVYQWHFRGKNREKLQEKVAMK